MDTRKIRIKNWNTYQHYKHRRPPWIKLHTSLLEDYEFECLQDASKLQLIAIWLVASRSKDIHTDGDPLLPDDEDYITKKAGLKQKIDLQPLIDSGFIIREAVSEEHREHGNGTPPRRKQSAGRTLSSGKQVVPPEPEPDSETDQIQSQNTLSSALADDPAPLNPQSDTPEDQDPMDRKSSNPKIRELIDLWNTTCTALPRVGVLSVMRANKIRLRLREHPITYWGEVFIRMNRTPFLIGEGERGWRASLDWVINNPDNADKVLGGTYDGVPKKAGQIDRILGGASHKPGKYAHLGKAGDRNAD